jgi:hypothetical protein
MTDGNGPDLRLLIMELDHLHLVVYQVDFGLGAPCC